MLLSIHREHPTLPERYHHHRRQGERGHAEHVLNLLLQTPEYRGEALLWRGIDALQQRQPQSAFAHFSAASVHLPQQIDIIALSVRAILAQGESALAEKLLSEALQHHPAAPALRQLMWQVRSQTCEPPALRQHIERALPDIESPQELRQVIQLLTALPVPVTTLGVVCFKSEQREIQGWAIDLQQPDRPVELLLAANGISARFPADKPHALLRQAGLSDRHGGIRIQIPSPTTAITVAFSNGQPLQGSPVAALAPVESVASATNDPARQPVDVLVPVFNGYQATLECLTSLLTHREANKTPHQIIVLDDASTDATLTTALQGMADAGDIELIRHPANLGFIRNINRGMALHPDRDVVWLNADTRVHGDWLDRLRAAAYAADDFASATPFTNNGELMSFPVSRVSQDMPDAETQAQLDQLCSQLNPAPIEIELGCGFCFYIKRRALTEVGLLDEIALRRGYGEETDWCLRARAQGWRHAGATNLFVAHEGGQSFGDEKALRVHQNNTLLKQRYPGAEARFNAFCQRDPLEPARAALQRARLPALAAWMGSQKAAEWPQASARQLHIAGTLLDNETLQGIPLILRYRNEGQTALATLHADWSALPLTLEYRLPAEADQLAQDLATLPVGELVYRQLTALPAALKALPKTLARPYRIASCDDALLADAPQVDWPAFARDALAVHLPWASLQARYDNALRGANLVITPAVDTIAPVTADAALTAHAVATPMALLIADHPLTPEIAQRWLALARSITQRSLPITLLLVRTTPWTKALVATGSVLRLRKFEALTTAEILRLAGCRAALSLNENPGASWLAPFDAAHHELPLFAPASDVAHEAGAQPLALLGIAPVSQIISQPNAPGAVLA